MYVIIYFPSTNIYSSTTMDIILSHDYMSAGDTPLELTPQAVLGLLGDLREALWGALEGAGELGAATIRMTMSYLENVYRQLTGLMEWQNRPDIPEHLLRERELEFQGSGQYIYNYR